MLYTSARPITSTDTHTFEEPYHSELIPSRFVTKNIWARHEITNSELQRFTDVYDSGIDPFSTDDDGVLAITADHAIGGTMGGQPFSSGIITTRGHTPAIQNGVVALQLKLPPGAGLWPAAWLYPQFRDWPEGIDVLPEIDIMEQIGRSPREIYQNVHTRLVGGPGDPLVTLLEGDSNRVPLEFDTTLDFHWYGVELTEDEIIFFVDDVETRRTIRPADLSGPLHLMLQLSVGGNWPGMPNETTPFPARLFCKEIRIEHTAPVVNSNLDLITELQDMRTDMVACLDAYVDARMRALRG